MKSAKAEILFENLTFNGSSNFVSCFLGPDECHSASMKKWVILSSPLHSEQLIESPSLSLSISLQARQNGHHIPYLPLCILGVRIGGPCCACPNPKRE